MAPDSYQNVIRPSLFKQRARPLLGLTVYCLCVFVLLLSACSLPIGGTEPPLRSQPTLAPTRLPTRTPTDAQTFQVIATTAPLPSTTPYDVRVGSKNALPSPTPLAEQGTAFVDGQTGSDTNPGSAAAPWRTLTKAISSIKPGAVVIIAAGIYRMTELRFGPPGVPDSPTVFRSAPGARVILTGLDDNPIQINLADYVRLDGLWMGGVYHRNNKHIIAPGGVPIGRGKQIINSTIFGYPGGIVVGAGEDLLIQNNRFVNNGADVHAAALYISSGSPAKGSLTQHIIVDHNIFVGGGGYGFQSWHGARNLIATRNFVGGHMWGAALDGTDSLFAQNFFWNETGGDGLPAWGLLISNPPNAVLNNIFGPHAWVNIGNARLNFPQLTFSSNAHTDSPHLPGTGGDTCKMPCGKGAVVLHQGQELAELGTTRQALDDALEALHNSFLQPVDSLLNDPSIEPNFAKLNVTIPPSSPLYQSGTPWFGQPINIGPDAPAPADFWEAVRALKLREYDRYGIPH